MAGTIPPLVSSSPPPLCPFDDEEEDDEEDEFGNYASVEDIDDNGAIFINNGHCKEKGGKKEGVDKDTTSQDSATDSGLCPDSEGVSPTPHSDEEKTVTQSTDIAPGLILPNGHVEHEDASSAVESNEFGSFSAGAPCEIATNQDALLNFEVENPELNLAAGLILHNLKLPEEDSKQSLQDSEFDAFKHSELGNIEPTKNEETSLVSEEFENFNSVESVSNSNQQLESFINMEPPIVTELVECESVSSATASEETAKLGELVKTKSSELDNGHKKVTGLGKDRDDSFACEFPTLVRNELQNSQQDNSCVNTQLENEKSKTLEEEHYQLENEDVEFDEFTDFKASFSDIAVFNLSENSETVVYSKCDSEEHQESSKEESDNEFSSFADFSSSECAFVSAQSNSVENPASTKTFPVRSSDDTELRTDSEFQDWESAFPGTAEESETGQTTLLRDNDVIWSQLKTIETSPALSYQWTDSLANRGLLKALNIDSRNILFMPWSSSAVPRFAANLSCGPLQPVKATEPLQQHISSSAQVEVVPDAHFDWGSSGLTNPLDSSHSSLLDLNFVMSLSTHLVSSPKPVLNLPKTLTAEAERVLGSLPQLFFMRKNYIVFPIKDTC